MVVVVLEAVGGVERLLILCIGVGVLRIGLLIGKGRVGEWWGCFELAFWAGKGFGDGRLIEKK